ncbi:Histone demethylation protein 3d [Fusarium sp. Ph1]|nr:Histone demethylation protein 3d [Fusarium sp. Ph1]
MRRDTNVDLEQQLVHDEPESGERTANETQELKTAEADDEHANPSITTNGRCERRFDRSNVDLRATTTLTAEALGRNMPCTLYGLSQPDNSHTVIRVPRIEVEKLGEDISKWMTPEARSDVRFNIFKKQRDDQVVRVYRDDPNKERDVWWPKFDTSRRRPTLEEAERMFESFLLNPPKGVPYYNGVMTMKRDDPCPFYPGDQLANFNAVTHINEKYIHLGKASSATAMHKEDMGLWSANCLETWVRKRWPEECQPCDQFVRHLNLLPPPRELREAGIKFEIIVQGPGDMIVTRKGQYHLVWNITDNFACSINLSPPAETLSIRHTKLRVCNECGLKGLLGVEGCLVEWVDRSVPSLAEEGFENTATTSRLKRKKTGDGQDDGKRRKPLPGRRNEAAAAAKSTVPARQSSRLHAARERDNSDLTKLAATVMSVYAIKHFVTEVKSHNAAIQNEGRDPAARDEKVTKVLQGYQRLVKVKGSRVQTRYQQVLFNKAYDGLKGHSERIVSETRAELTKICGVTIFKIDNDRRAGKAWEKVCGKLGPGLLPFIPTCPSASAPFHMATKEYLELGGSKGDPKRRRNLQQLLDNDYMEKICAAGHAFLKATNDGKKITFAFVSEEDDLDWDAMSKDDILAQLRVLEDEL